MDGSFTRHTASFQRTLVESSLTESAHTTFRNVNVHG